MGNPRNNLIGCVYGKLLVVDYAGKDYKNNTMWLCKCKCGNEKVVRGSKLKSGEVKSCGCLRHEDNPVKNENIRLSKIKHNKSNTRLYYIYNNMVRRCEDPKSNKYRLYGGRGISVCKEWRYDINTFFEWAEMSGYHDNLTIDRINVNGNYCPDNCRWTNMKVQSNNKTNNILITYNDETHTVTEWSDIIGINSKTIYARLKRGWDCVDAITKPVRQITFPK